MWSKMKQLVLLITFFVVTLYSVTLIYRYQNQIFANGKDVIVVTESTTTLLSDLETIAEDNHLVFAKQIMVASTDGKSDNQPSFYKIGQGNIPSNFKLQKNQKIIENSSNNVLYFVFGKSVNVKKITSQLNQKGHQVAIYDNNWLFQIILSIFDPDIFLGFLLLLMTLLIVSLSIGVSNLKKAGLQRLSGLSKSQIAFGHFKNESLYHIFLTLLSLAVGEALLYSKKLTSLTYGEMLLVTLLFWFLVTGVTLFLADCLIWFVLSKQSLEMSIKHKAPIRFLQNLLTLLEVISVLMVMFSISRFLTNQGELSQLNEASYNWKKHDNIYSASLMNGGTDAESLQNFLKDFASSSDLMLVGDNLNFAKRSQYLPNANSDENVLFVTPNFIEKSQLTIPKTAQEKLGHLAEKEYMILVPESQSQNEDDLSSKWNDRISEYGSIDVSYSSAVYSKKEKFFTYRIFGSFAITNTSFAENPIIIVVNLETFQAADTFKFYFESWMSKQQLLFSDKEKFMSLVSKYDLESSVGSLLNGENALQTRMANLRLKQIYLLISNLISVMSLLLLGSLLNTIYFYQNRKKFFIEWLSGKTFLQTHWRHLIDLVLMLGILSFVVPIFSLPILVMLVPFSFATLVILQFYLQSKFVKRDVSLLKGE
ncbi:DUF1430 domain-containing protein [Streptococcus loxodontisalivarius]|uniref:ABC transport system permease protein n=1 Tax=Streptococcus loxodontisalivarius TaxID=1349415 RepID=A0ABS2PQU4_9STRE|nr:DUF1430 domain-containing protein [Streptococcus loxodontisalivarius]MBM7642246.1 putative ABC transport system permease protein [Streptococcus loxodontisalivarius]